MIIILDLNICPLYWYRTYFILPIQSLLTAECAYKSIYVGLVMLVSISIYSLYCWVTKEFFILIKKAIILSCHLNEFKFVLKCYNVSKRHLFSFTNWFLFSLKKSCLTENISSRFSQLYMMYGQQVDNTACKCVFWMLNRDNWLIHVCDL